MIDRTELLRLATELGLEPRVVEKDYVLGWVLAGIYRDPALAGSWVFKGGTCLKKCYFETYRFSEDLDFTVTDPAQIEGSFLQEHFTALSAWLYDETGIELPIELLRFDIWQNSRGRPAGQGRIAYRGPIAPRGGDLPRIKLDLTADETLVLSAVTRPVAHAYSDIPAHGIVAQCYAFEEVFGEKIRALRERARPRDLYDVINLFRNGEFRAAAAVIRNIVHQKCTFKNVSFPTLESLAEFRDELIGDWATMLRHQLPSLPPVENFWGALPEFFQWLAGATPPVMAAAYPLGVGEEVLRAPAGAIQIAGRTTPFVEVIRFAGANHLCVELDYITREGRRSTRVIEPYSLRRTQAGDILLHAVRADEQQHRSYLLQNIQGARVTNRTFIPRYAVELTPAGPLVAPSAAIRAGGPRSIWGVPPTRRSRSVSYSPTYLFRCPTCNKRFERKTYDATLRAHKTPGGWDCYGRHGIFEGQR